MRLIGSGERKKTPLKEKTKVDQPGENEVTSQDDWIGGASFCVLGHELVTKNGRRRIC